MVDNAQNLLMGLSPEIIVKIKEESLIVVGQTVLRPRDSEEMSKEEMSKDYEDYA